MEPLRFTVNGTEYTFARGGQGALPDTETLRETLHQRVPGIDLKKNCDRGICGNCTVLLNGKPVSACMTLTASCEGADIVTWEGLSGEEAQLYERFKSCGYFEKHAAYISIRGLVMICIAQFREKRTPTREDFVEALNGNYGRCLDIDIILEQIDRYKESLPSDQMSGNVIQERNEAHMADAGKGGAE